MNLYFGRRRAFAAVLLSIAVLLVMSCGLISFSANNPPDSSGQGPIQLAPTYAGPTFAAQTPSNAPILTLPTPSSAQLLQPSGNIENDVRSVVDRVRPAVVFVGIEANLSNFSQPVPVGNGSGAIIDQQGHILTNNHVVASATALKVTLPDGRTFDAKVIGADPVTDLAVIQIPANANLPTIPLGDSSQLRVGDWVVAIGNALGLEGGPTVTQGVVSAMDRTITEQNGASISGLIQTDAAINPGNSGGPLVNLRGELVGINTAVPGPTGQGVQPSGIGFAISINEAKPIIQQLLAQGRVVRPYLGIAPVTLTPAIAAQLGLSVTQGVVVDTIAPTSPAAQAGLQQGDVIVAVDGQGIKSDTQLRQAIQQHKIGDTMTLTIIRNGQQMDVKATLAQSPAP